MTINNAFANAGCTERNGWSLVPTVKIVTVVIALWFLLIESLIFLAVDMAIQVVALLLTNTYLIAIILRMAEEGKVLSQHVVGLDDDVHY